MPYDPMRDRSLGEELAIFLAGLATLGLYDLEVARAQAELDDQERR